MSQSHLAPADTQTRSSVLSLPPTLWHAVLVQAPILVLLFSRPFYANTDPDYWWHFKTGEYIWTTRSLPTTDIFSYRAAGMPWVTHEWLSEVLLYLVQANWGYVANVALFALLSVVTWLAVYSACRVRGSGELASSLLMILAFAASMPVINVRPQMLTLLLFAVYALVLARYREGKRAYVLALPILMTLWVNLHGGYVIGLLLLGLALAGEVVDEMRGRPHAAIRPLLIATVLTAAATIVSPHGLQGLLYPFTYAGTGNASMRYIAEWQSPNFHQANMLPFAVMLLLVTVVGAASRPARATDVLWVGALAFMALQSARHMPLFAVVAAPLLGARLVERSDAFARLTSRWRRPRTLLAVWPAMLLLLVVAASRPGGPAAQTGAEPSHATYPQGAVEYLRRHRDGRLLNLYAWGGYLIYHLYPDHQVFADGRADVYGDELMEEYMTVDRLRLGWDDVLEEWDVGLVLVPKHSALAAVLRDSRRWHQVLEGEVEALFRAV